MSDDTTPRYLFQEGEYVLLVDKRGRRYLICLNGSDIYHTHLGEVKHSDIIGEKEGSRLVTSKGHVLLVVKPTLTDFTRLMPRIATVIYPKDLGAIIALADIFPGARVLEAGTGSGAVTIALTRAVGPEGRVFSYDLRSDMLERASANVRAIFSSHSQLSIEQGDVYEGIREDNLDRVVLDLPEPWNVIPHAAEALVPGGILLSFLPTILQVHQLSMGLKEQGSFDLIETLDIYLCFRTFLVLLLYPIFQEDHFYQIFLYHQGFLQLAFHLLYLIEH